MRLVHKRDAYRLADYYAENRLFLKPWEPVRDNSHCSPAGWQVRLGMITEMQKQGSAYYFILLDAQEHEVRGVANFSNVLRDAFHACFLGYSLGEKWQGQGLMYEALQPAIHYMQRVISTCIASWPTACRTIIVAAHCSPAWDLNLRGMPRIIC